MLKINFYSCVPQIDHPVALWHSWLNFKILPLLKKWTNNCFAYVRTLSLLYKLCLYIISVKNINTVFAYLLDTSTCKCVPMNPSWGHLWPPFVKGSQELRIWDDLRAFSTFLQGGKSTKPLVKDPFVKPSGSGSFWIKQPSVVFSRTIPSTFYSRIILYLTYIN